MTSSADIVVPSVGDVTDPDIIQTIKDAIAAREANSSISGTLAVGTNLTVSGNLTVTGIGGWLAAYKTAAESVTSSTTLQDDDHLKLVGLAGAVYEGELWAPYTGDTTGDIKFRFTFPSSDFLWGPMRLPVAATTTNAATPDWGGELVTAGTNSATVSGGATSGLPILWIPFTWAPTSAGTLQFQWAQNVSSGTALTLQKYSKIKARRIA